jgi:hypothetical protein
VSELEDLDGPERSRKRDSCAAHCRPSQGDYCGGPCLDDLDGPETVES